MVTIISYLEKLGYTVLEQGKTAKFASIFHDGIPIGFLMPDLTLKVFPDTACDGLQNAIEFVKANTALEPVGNGEYLLAVSMGNKLTTYFDMDKKAVLFAVYIVGTDDAMHSYLYETEDEAKYSFITYSGLLPKSVSGIERKSWTYQLRERLISYLVRKNTPRKGV